MTHICVVKPTIIGTDNGLSPGRRKAIIWTNAGILLIRTLGTNFSEILGKIHSFLFSKMHLKMSSAKGRLFSLGLNELTFGQSKENASTCNHYTVECRCYAVQLIPILPKALRWYQQNVNQTSGSQHAPHASPSQASYCVSIMTILNKIDRVITAPQSIPMPTA